jgi:O-antigen/teichoic acid export membrane protein
MIKNLSAQLVGRVVRLSSGAIISVLVARVLGVEAFGTYTVLVASMMVFTFAVDAGLSTLVVRELSRTPGEVRRFVRHGSLIVLVTSVLAFLVLWVATQLLGNDWLSPSLLVIAFAWFVVGVFSVQLSGVFFAFERMELDLITVLIELTTTVLLLVFLLPRLELALDGLFLLLLISRTANFAASIMLYRKLVAPYPVTPTLNRTYAWELVRKAAPFSLNQLVNQINSVILLIIALFTSEAELGLLRSAHIMVFSLITILALAVGNTIYPRLSKHHTKDAPAFQDTFDQSFDFLLVAGSSIAIFVFWQADWLLGVVFGPEFETAAVFLRIFALVIPLRYLNTLANIALSAIDRQGTRVAANLIGNVLKVLGLVWFLPRFGPISAAWTLLGIEFLAWLGLYGVFSRWTDFRIRPVRLVPMVVAGTLIGLGLQFDLREVPAFVSMVASLVIFLAAAIICHPMLRKPFSLHT